MWTKWSPNNSFSSLLMINVNISSVFGIKDTLLSCNPSGLHSQTPRPLAAEGLGPGGRAGGVIRSEN